MEREGENPAHSTGCITVGETGAEKLTLLGKDSTLYLLIS